MSADSVVYIDSSALVKLVLEEDESGPLAAYLERAESVHASALVRAEVPRAARRSLDPRAPARAHLVVDEIDLIALDEDLLVDAAKVGDAALRTLDAIHLAAALTLGDELDAVVTYDQRMAEAARALGLQVESPQ